MGRLKSKVRAERPSSRFFSKLRSGVEQSKVLSTGGSYRDLQTFWHQDVLALDVLAPRRFGTSKVNFSRCFGSSMKAMTAPRPICRARNLFFLISSNSACTSKNDNGTMFLCQSAISKTNSKSFQINYFRFYGYFLPCKSYQSQCRGFQLNIHIYIKLNVLAFYYVYPTIKKCIFQASCDFLNNHSYLTLIGRFFGGFVLNMLWWTDPNNGNRTNYPEHMKAHH